MSENAQTRMAKARERRLLTCRHFTGIQNNTCGLGIFYDSCEKPLPCLPPYRDDADQSQGECAMRVFYTPEDLDREDRERDAFLFNMAKARTAIVAHMDERGTRKTNTSSALPCPCCDGGTLAYRCAGAYNGHIHARCSTEGCVAWME